MKRYRGRKLVDYKIPDAFKHLAIYKGRMFSAFRWAGFDGWQKWDRHIQGDPIEREAYRLYYTKYYLRWIKLKPRFVVVRGL